MAEDTAATAAARPLIGICAYPGFEDKGLTVVDNHYVDAIWHAGGIPVMLPVGLEAADNARALMGRLDGLLLTGGGDIAPEAFGGRAYPEGASSETYYSSPERDAFEGAAVLAAWEIDLPCLGVCRGMQVMNVVFGGTIVRDISELGEGMLAHSNFGKGAEVAHHVRVGATTVLHELLGVEDLPVNSMHHQAIKDLAHGAHVSAVAPDGIIEGIEFPGKGFFLGVQWHPEQLMSTPQLFGALVEAARKGAPDRMALMA